MASPILFADETSWRLLQRDSKKWWVWGAASHDAVYYEIRDSRATEAAEGLLEGYKGTVMADGYGVYESLANLYAKSKVTPSGAVQIPLPQPCAEQTATSAGTAPNALAKGTFQAHRGQDHQHPRSDEQD